MNWIYRVQPFSFFSKGNKNCITQLSESFELVCNYVILVFWLKSSSYSKKRKNDNHVFQEWERKILLCTAKSKRHLRLLNNNSIYFSVVSTNAKIGAPSSASAAASNGRANSNATTAATAAAAAKNYNQPDLVKVSSPGPQQDLHREVRQLRERLGHNAKGFTAMAVALSHVTKEVSFIVFKS